MTLSIPRREFLAGAGATAFVGALSGCAPAVLRPLSSSQLVLPPLRLAPDRISAITVCTRPFRAQGPRLEGERLGNKTVIHHYGHGGSGWSLSWGSGYEVMQRGGAPPPPPLRGRRRRGRCPWTKSAGK
jgi:hypothetical protein